MTYTLAFLTRPKPGITLEKFYQHYTEVHRPLAEKLPGLLSYRQTRILKEGYRGDDAIDYAAYSEYTFENEGDAATAFESPEGIALNEDTGRFMDWPSVLTIPLAELGTYRS
ncbi:MULTISPECIES: EthD domain-containing protein [Arthrobacter]|uniref:EthD family reductase n=1 Tax=Arthrobacter terricola TaxID=2547396 RepID=A0A4R5KAW3_9MICC|nr:MULTISPECIES: EthD domain-containing protein [Arthrobacter]MBT8163163.1 EthD family reductase [Arthrobacter sp. GN70]TDF91267.1 EthD family reductase [Arthrobacter terricola]